MEIITNNGVDVKVCYEGYTYTKKCSNKHRGQSCKEAKDRRGK